MGGDSEQTGARIWAKKYLNQPDWSEKSFPAAITQEQVKNSPNIDTDKPVSRQHEIAYSAYYGYP
jgi:hypothetical protein